MNAPLYTPDILRLAASIPGLEPIADAQGAAERRSPTCGAKMAVAVRLDEEGRIEALSQRVEACAFGQAAAALVGAHAVGKDSAEVRTALDGLELWLKGDDEAAASWPGLAVLALARAKTARHGAILLPFRTLLAAMEEAG